MFRDPANAPATCTSVLLAGLPQSADLVMVFGNPSRPASGALSMLDAAGELAQHHLAQWQAEDLSRDHHTDDAAVAQAKRQIDAMNLMRAELVDRVDSLIDDSLPADPRASLHTETLGQLVDRLAVAWVRSRRLAEVAGSDAALRSDARRAMMLLTQLCDAYDDLLRDLRDGRRRLPAWRTLKRYGTTR